eukprot:m.49663 g.49663  ORF g.49663 m.49663 type:complete len:585 (+) comp15337_c1_seq3:207-1961(+)
MSIMLHAPHSPCLSKTAQSSPAKISVPSSSKLMAPALNNVTIFEDDAANVCESPAANSNPSDDIPHVMTMARSTPFRNSDIITTGGGTDFSSEDILDATPMDVHNASGLGAVVDDWCIARKRQHDNECYTDETMGVATLFCTRLDSSSDALEITGHLGEGTFGSVDCAHLYRDDVPDDDGGREDLSLSGSLDYQSVVVKEVFRDDVSHDKIFKAVSLAEDVHHEHVVRIQSYMLTRENRIAVISERGTSLYHRLHLQVPAAGGSGINQATTPLRHSVAIDWALQVASGMRYIHSVIGVTMCNLNSHNVIIYGEEYDDDLTHQHSCTLKITDYYAANMLDSSVPCSAMLSKACWMAPEVLRATPRRKITHAADVWSFGMLLWEMLTQQPPFWGWEATEMFRVVLQASAGKSSRHLFPTSSKISSDVAEFLAQCWHSAPQDRIRASRILDALKGMWKCLETSDAHHPSMVAKTSSGDSFWHARVAEPSPQRRQRSLSASFRGGLNSFNSMLDRGMEKIKNSIKSKSSTESLLVVGVLSPSAGGQHLTLPKDGSCAEVFKLLNSSEEDVESISLPPSVNSPYKMPRP